MGFWCLMSRSQNQTKRFIKESDTLFQQARQPWAEYDNNMSKGRTSSSNYSTIPPCWEIDNRCGATYLINTYWDLCSIMCFELYEFGHDTTNPNIRQIQHKTKRVSETSWRGQETKNIIRVCKSFQGATQRATMLQ